MQWWRAALAALSLAAAAGIAGGVGGAGGAEGAAPAERLSPETVAKVEQTLLAMLGLKRRPRPSKGTPRVFVPAAMLALYEQLSHPDSDHPLPPPFTQQTPLQHRVANTVRSFTHQGMPDVELCTFRVRLRSRRFPFAQRGFTRNRRFLVEFIKRWCLLLQKAPLTKGSKVTTSSGWPSM